ncbi:hypothetical protein [Comamonas odontotermitis]|uniref:hypothetical protein n=1 Tax=Comamonas odontotermitis TaxID=379895 RepID=UPI001CC457B0|nr:hypothetical protein [Comamonas odontotermitis]UBB17673.1 hypothetical protein LAD35_03225 [Comamonas odontotermitis]
MNLILERSESVPFYTEMCRVFDALGLQASDYDWFISDIETNIRVPGLSNEDQWIQGECLEQIIRSQEVQFIWAVFSAFPKGCRFEISVPPYVDGNPSYWDGEEHGPQLENALFEIAAWDSSATIFIGLSKEAELRFIRAYPETKPLISARV